MEIERSKECAHCGSARVQHHCVGVTVAQCPWVWCKECGWTTDHAGRTYDAAAHKDDDRRG